MSGPVNPCGGIMPCFRTARTVTWSQLERETLANSIAKQQKMLRDVEGGAYLAEIVRKHGSSSSSPPGTRISSLEEIEKAFENASGGSDEESSAFSRWLSCCSNPDEARRAFDSTNNSRRENESFDRWLELCSTPDEARRAYNYTNNSGREEKARERIRELGGDV
jgi:hypothetical protein